MTWVSWVLIVTGVMLNAAAQLLLKAATRGLAHMDSFGLPQLSSAIVVLSKSAAFWGGMLCYGVSVCVWIAALTKAPVSTAYPMLSLGYVVVACIASLGFGEAMTPAKIFGIALICAGVVLVSRSNA